jgi:hypothetical protein
MKWRRPVHRPVHLPSWGALCLGVLLVAACAQGQRPDLVVNPAQPGPQRAPDGGVQAIDSSRGLTAPEWGRSGNNTGSWGGQQLPNIPAAPRL